MAGAIAGNASPFIWFYYILKPEQYLRLLTCPSLPPPNPPSLVAQKFHRSNTTVSGSYFSGDKSLQLIPATTFNTSMHNCRSSITATMCWVACLQVKKLVVNSSLKESPLSLSCDGPHRDRNDLLILVLHSIHFRMKRWHNPKCDKLEILGVEVQFRHGILEFVNVYIPPCDFLSFTSKLLF